MSHYITQGSINRSRWWTSLSPITMAVLDFVLSRWLPRQWCLPIAVVTVLFLLVLLQNGKLDKWFIVLISLIGIATYGVLRLLHG